MGPQIHVTICHISSFQTYLRHIQDIRCKYCNVLMLHSGNIKQAIMDNRNEKSLNSIEIMEEDTENVVDPSEYRQMAWESV